MGSDLIDGVEERSHLGSQRAKRRCRVFILPRRFDNLDHIRQVWLFCSKCQQGPQREVNHTRLLEKLLEIKSEIV